MAPILILLAMAAWDGGAVLREQVVLQQAARDGARVAATAFGQGGVSGVTIQTIDAAVRASAADLPGLSATPGYLAVTYPASPAQSVKVTLRYDHSLYTPVLRRIWGGVNGVVTLQATAVFLVPQLTQTPPTIVPSTPLPTPTQTPLPSATPTPTPQPTPTRTQTPLPTATLTQTPIPTSTPTQTPLPTATPTRTLVPTATYTPTLPPTSTPTQTRTSTPTPTVTPTTCTVAVVIPDLADDTGYWVVIQTSRVGSVSASWTVGTSDSNLDLSLYSGNQSSTPNPSAARPPTTPSPLQTNSGIPPPAISVNVPNLAIGTYSFYFFKPGQGQNLVGPSSAAIRYAKATCP